MKFFTIDGAYIKTFGNVKMAYLERGFVKHSLNFV